MKVCLKTDKFIILNLFFDKNSRKDFTILNIGPYLFSLNILPFTYDKSIYLMKKLITILCE